MAAGVSIDSLWERITVCEKVKGSLLENLLKLHPQGTWPQLHTSSGISCNQLLYSLSTLILPWDMVIKGRCLGRMSPNCMHPLATHAAIAHILWHLTQSKKKALGQGYQEYPGRTSGTSNCATRPYGFLIQKLFQSPFLRCFFCNGEVNFFHLPLFFLFCACMYTVHFYVLESNLMKLTFRSMPFLSIAYTLLISNQSAAFIEYLTSLPLCCVQSIFCVGIYCMYKGV